MYPALLAHQLQDTVLDYLRSTFHLRDETLERVLLEWLRHPNHGLFRGPYLDLRLPFRRAQRADMQSAFPLDVAPSFAPYEHQLRAWQRLSSRDHAPRSTLITTGTGSGKTECFLYPLLDHCWRQGQLSGKEGPGIRAIILYPMNALASDQAERIAKELWEWRPDGAAAGEAPLRGKVRAGLYVGGKGEHRCAGPKHLIDDRKMLRQCPPQILLTNYRMLDLLLMRPEDRSLWAYNGPDTLQYLVLDELHTYDGAQGSDVACLLRRLRERLGMEAGSGCCIGTSATIGEGEAGRGQLLKFAESVFGQAIDADAIIGESRQSLSETFPDVAEDGVFYPGQQAQRQQAQRQQAQRQHLRVDPEAGLEGKGESIPELDPNRYVEPQQYLEDQARLWLGQAPLPGNQDGIEEGEEEATGSAGTRPSATRWIDEDPSSAIRLGQRLATHPFLHELLKALQDRGGGPQSLLDLVEDFGQSESMCRALGHTTEHRRLAVISFLSLLSHARAGTPDKPRPFLWMQIQLWLRELRGLLRKVTAGRPQLAWRDTIVHHPDRSENYLPQVLCRECGHQGWGATQRERECNLRGGREFNDVGEAYFKGDSSARFIELRNDGDDDDEAHRDANMFLCPQCLHTGPEFRSCRHDERSVRCLPVRIHKPNQKGKTSTLECPSCGARDRLGILGSRAATLSSVLIGHLFATPFNRDRKLLAFSDSVQDASHRAGFFSSRTYRFNLRTALQSVLEAEAQGSIAWTELLDRTIAFWQAKLESGAQAQGRLITTFVPPDLHQHVEYRKYVESWKASPSSRSSAMSKAAYELMQRRLSWELAYELSLGGRIGRSLERSGCATACIEASRLASASDCWAQDLREQIFPQLHGLDLGQLLAALRHFLRGLLHRLRLQGGVFHPLLEEYALKGERFCLSRARAPCLPYFPAQSSIPRFIFAGHNHRIFDNLKSKGNAVNWYRDFLARNLARCLAQSSGQSLGDFKIDPKSAEISKALDMAMQRLVAAGIMQERESARGRIFGLCATALWVTRKVASIACDVCNAKHFVASHELDDWLAQPCIRFRCSGHYQALNNADQAGYYAKLYRRGALGRVFAREHTGLLVRKDREALENDFKSQVRPDAPNLLTCTPTLEMGIDVGDLSAVFLCSVPPLPANYLQRIGRAGRSTGNSLILTMATSRPHDHYFFEEPESMMRGKVRPPGCFLNASEILARQMLAHCLDQWAKEAPEAEIPNKMQLITQGQAEAIFPEPFYRYYRKHRVAIHDRFLQMFEDVLQGPARQRLDQMTQGEGLIQLMQDAFGGIDEERKILSRRIHQLKVRLDKLEQNIEEPVFNTEDPEKSLDTEKNEIKYALSRYQLERKNLGHKHPLNVLTDVGVLPNFAFPEPGVILRTAVYEGQPKGSPKNHRQKKGVPRAAKVREYLRPSTAALREFAPFNHFYADGKKVKVTQLDIGSKNRPIIERWRLCSDCQHVEIEVEKGDVPSQCPSCGNHGWDDIGRVREMLEFRRAWSNSTLAEASTSDDHEDRQRESYEILELIDVEEKNKLNKALLFENERLLFGYELLQNLTLRELNFGRHSDAHGVLAVAGRQIAQHGFIVCRDCGHVQSPGHPSHLPYCRARKAPESARCEPVILYRAIQSEAIRVLLPLSNHEPSENEATMRATFELGLRTFFQGRPSHLRVTQSSEPDGDGRRRYLVIYDNVPGGTGFLAEVWQDNKIFAVLDCAHAVLKNCACGDDPQRDGCYQCIFAYQHQRDLQKISRQRALRFLERLSEAGTRDSMRTCESLSNVSVERLMESELEEKFMAALTKVEGISGWRIEPIQVRGRDAWRLRTGGVDAPVWRIESQVDLDQSEHVEEPCRPDFVCYPEFEDGFDNPELRAIAIFTDGLRWHVMPEKKQARIADDIRKRKSILESGRFWVWSLTWDDVCDFEGRFSVRHCPKFLGLHQGLMGPDAQKILTQVDKLIGEPPFVGDIVGENSVSLLIRFLCEPAVDRWSLGVTRLFLSGLDINERWDESQLSKVRDQLRNDPLPLNKPKAQGKSDDKEFTGWMAMGHVRTLISIPVSCIRKKTLNLNKLSILMRLYDDPSSRLSEDFKFSWRAFWQQWNLAQFLHKAPELMSSQLIEEEQGTRDSSPDSGMASSPAVGPGPAVVEDAHRQPPSTTIESCGWSAIIEDFGDDLLALYRACSAQGIESPKLDCFLYEDKAEPSAVLAWPNQRVCLCNNLHPLDEDEWKRHGWQAFDFDDHDPNQVAHAILLRSAA